MQVLNNDFKNTVCPMCNSIDIVEVGKIKYHENVFFSSEEIKLTKTPEYWKCRQCNSSFVQNILQEKTALSLYSKSDSSQRWNQNIFVNTKPSNMIFKLKGIFFNKGKLLDVGCNTGELLDFAKEEGCLTYGLELSGQSQKILEEKGHGIYHSMDEIDDNSLDIITAFDLIEHIYNLQAFMASCKQKLKKNGHLVVLTGNSESYSSYMAKEKWWYILYPEHIRFPAINYYKCYSGFTVVDSLFTYASIGYIGKRFDIIKAFIIGIIFNRYSGLPSLGPDHHLIVLKNDLEVHCPLCGEYCRIMHGNKLYDDRYGYQGIFSLFQCTSCHHKYVNHSFSSADLGDLYSNYYPRSELSIHDYKPLTYKAGFISWFNGEKCSAYTYVPKNVRILDIGCGFGQSLGYHKERGCDVYGVEADSNIAKIIDQYGFNIKVGLFDAADYECGFFDYVTMNQVLEHTTNPIEIMQGISSILKKDGILVISVPNSNGWGARFFGKRWINWHIPYHLQHFSKESMNKVAKKTNFEIISFKTITSSEWLCYQWLSFFTFPSLGEKSFFWSASKQKKSFGIKVICRLLSIIHRTKINHVITRVFDALGFGDNYVVILKRKEE